MRKEESHGLRLRKSFAIGLVLGVFILPAAPSVYAQVDSNAAGSASVRDANATGPAVPISAEAAEAEAVAKLTVEQLQARKKQAIEPQDLSEEAKAKLTDVYDKAVAQLELANQLKAATQQFKQARENAPAKLEEVKKLLGQSASVPAPQVDPNTTLTQAEQAMGKAFLGLTEVKKRASELENEPKKRAERRTKIPEEYNTNKQQLEEIKKKLAGLVPEEQKTALAQANRTLLLLQQMSLQNRIEANTEEFLFYNAASDLLAAQRDLAAKDLAAAEKLVAFWREKVEGYRRVEAEAAKEEAIRASKEAESAHPLIQQVAKDNADLAQLQADLVAKMATVSQETRQITEQLTTLEKEFEDINERVEKAGGITDVMGVLLLAKRSSLPNVSANRRRIHNRLAEISNALLEWDKHDNEWSELSDIEKSADALMSEQEPAISEAKREVIRSEIIGHLQTKRKTLKAISDLYQNYSTSLANLDTREQTLVQTVDEYASFIDQNILWVKSSGVVTLSDFNDSVEALKWLFSASNWRQAGRVLLADSKVNPVPYLIILLVFAFFAIFHSKMHGRIDTISKEIREVRVDSFLLTAKAMTSTVILAAMWPSFLLLIERRLSAVGSEDEFIGAITPGLKDLAAVMFLLSFLRHLVLPHGLAQDHFRLREESLIFLRRQLLWFSIAIIPVFFVIRAMHEQGFNDHWHGTVGRLFFMAALLELLIFFLIVLRPTSPLMQSYFEQRRGGWLERLRYIWYPLCVLLPLVFAVLAGMGYFYGARHLNAKLLETIILVLLALLARAVFVRWLTVARRKLAIQERQKQLAFAAEEKGKETELSTASGKSSESQEFRVRPEQTIFEMSRQTRRLISAVTAALMVLGFWYIWNDVLPAFAAFGKATLWKTTTAGGAPQDITLSLLVIAILIVSLTIVVARNVPGLLEIVILRRLPLDRGVRFAITTFCRYVLVVIGIVLAFYEIGIGWSKVQWLIAAMTVGLGFGLQEIFANFISGLIILVEQPIRVDDVVTVADVTGTVTKIRVRATTIRKWDQRELIVPNKEFTTGQLINWTLTDNVLRRDFPVGIAYGSDIAKAERVLYEVALANPLVLKEPKPMVLFRGFGNSSLDFELRVYVTGIESFLPVWHSINCAIDQAFRKVGIEIAFPQRDVHIRSSTNGTTFDPEKSPDLPAPRDI